MNRPKRKGASPPLSMRVKDRDPFRRAGSEVEREEAAVRRTRKVGAIEASSAERLVEPRREAGRVRHLLLLAPADVADGVDRVRVPPGSRPTYSDQMIEVPPVPWRKTTGSPSPAHRYAARRPGKRGDVECRRRIRPQLAPEHVFHHAEALACTFSDRHRPVHGAFMVRVYHNVGAEASGSRGPAATRSPTPSSASR